MIYLDESGDDGKYIITNSKFFVVCIVISDGDTSLENNYLELKKCLNIKKKVLKWNNLNNAERLKFIDYITNKKLEYEVFGVWVDKTRLNNFDDLYKNMSLKIFKNIKTGKGNNLNAVIKYKGLHLRNMFEKIRREIKKENIILSFKENDPSAFFGITFADLWAGYINYANKNNLKIKQKIILKEYPD